VSFAGGRTVQVSLPPALVATARRGVANYQAWWRAIETFGSTVSCCASAITPRDRQPAAGALRAARARTS
jgi:hypothetical protein